MISGCIGLIHFPCERGIHRASTLCERRLRFGAHEHSGLEKCIGVVHIDADTHRARTLVDGPTDETDPTRELHGRDGLPFGT